MSGRNRFLGSAVLAAGLMMAVSGGAAFAADGTGNNLTGVASSTSPMGSTPPPAPASSTTMAATTPMTHVTPHHVLRHRATTASLASPGVNNPAATTITGASANAKGSPNSGVTAVPGAPSAGPVNGGGAK